MKLLEHKKGNARLISIIAVVASLIAGGGYVLYTQGGKSTAPPKIVGKTEAEANGPPVVRSAGITVAVPASTTPTAEETSSTTESDVAE